MKLFFKAAGLLATALLITGGVAPVAQGQALQVVTPEDQDAYVQQFHHEGDTPPVVDGVGGYTEQEVAEIHEAIRQAQESGAPKEELIPGEMWSDKVELPATIDKAAADEAEIAIAQQESQPQARGLATAASCQTFWPSPHQVCGAILERYIQQGAQFGWMLLPSEGQALNPDGQGYRQRFMAGFIYWHPTTGAHAVNNYSAQVWERNGWEAGWMGYPTGGEVPVTGSNPIDGELSGWVQTFQGGRVYRSPVLDGFQVASINGLILDKWLELGGPNSELGFPIADEAVTSDGVGRFSIFQHGAIYWHPSTGAHPISGINLMLWQNAGAESSEYGYPIESPSLDEFGRYTQAFQFKNLDLADVTQSAGTVNFDGKEISSLMMDLMQELADKYGIDLGSSSSSAAADTMMLRQTVYPFPPTPYPGGVPIPGDYEFYGPNSKDSLHDFCTKSPDELPAVGVNASFHGACARHDMCYDKAQHIETGGHFGRTRSGEIVYKDEAAAFRLCDSQFQSNLVTVCKNVYNFINPNRAYCLQTSNVYYGFVVGAHDWHYLPTGA